MIIPIVNSISYGSVFIFAMKGVFSFSNFFSFRHLYIFFLLTRDKFCHDKHMLGEITRNITALSDKLVDRYQQLFANSRLYRLSCLNERKILLF